MPKQANQQNALPNKQTKSKTTKQYNTNKQTNTQNKQTHNPKKQKYAKQTN